MKFLRLLRDNWALAVVLVVALVLLAFAPPVQTWVAQWALSQQTSVEASVGGFWAKFGKVQISDLSLKTPGATLTLPSLEAELPLMTAAWNRRISVRRLVAKGWTLDLRGADVAKSTKQEPTESVLAAAGDPSAFARAAVVSTETAIRFFRANLGRWALPCDLSLDGIELEGDVLVTAVPGHEPTRVHVVISGGGLAAGREGAFAIDATSALLKTEPATVALAAHGRFTLAMNTPRTLGRVGIKVDVSAFGGAYPEGFVLSEDVSADAAAGEGRFSLNLNRGGRTLLTVLAHVPDTANRLAGTWKLDLQDSDLAAIVAGSKPPPLAAKGEGTFDSDATVARIHALGRLSVAASQLGVLAPPLERLGAVNLEASFDAILGGPSIRVDHLSATLAGAAPVADARSLQAFDLDVHTGAIKLANPSGDWLALTVRKLPLAWLPASADGLTLSGADAAGEFVVRLRADGFVLRSTERLTAAGVSVQRADRIFARNLDLSALVLADAGAQGWQFQFAPLAVASGGSSLAIFKGSLSLPAAPDQPVAIAGIWTADLAAIAAQAVLPDVKWLGGRSASGDLTATLGDMATWDSKLTVLWTDPNDTATASVHAEFDGGRLLLRVPLKVTFGSARSDLTIETTSFRDAIGDQFYLKLTGKRADLDHLKLAAARLVASGILPAPSAADVRDPIPFWGDWTGRVSVMLERLDAGHQVFEYVGGAFEVKRNLVQLEEGGGKLGERHLTNAVGSLAFDPAAKIPYRLTGTATLDGVDATALFPIPSSGADPVIDGRFTLAGTLTGDGINRDDLVGRVRESLKITSTAGAVRLLKTDVHEAIPPEKQTAVGDDLGRVGSGIGSIFGAGNGIGSGRRKVSPEVQAAIDVINAVSEIGYDEASLTAVQESDGTIRLADIVMVAGDVRMTGSGQIGHVEGRAIRAQPLSVDLQFWVKGRMAKLMAAAGLLSDRKDDHGYTALKEPILLRGTLEKIDTSQWHAVMVKSAQRAPGSVKPAVH